MVTGHSLNTPWCRITPPLHMHALQAFAPQMVASVSHFGPSPRLWYPDKVKWSRGRCVMKSLARRQSAPAKQVWTIPSRRRACSGTCVMT